MRYFLSRETVLKRLEVPYAYNIKKDDLYELDADSYEFLKNCQKKGGGACNEKKFIDYCLNEGILTKDMALSRRPALKKSPSPSLRYLELQITDRCNLRCKHCYIGKKSFSELSVTQINNVLHEFEDMQGLRVLITGGEPLMHSRFREINDMLPDFFIRKVLFTNGMLLNIDILKNLNAEEIQISIDGLEEAHDSLRGRGTFKAAMKAVSLCLNSGFEVSVSTMIHAKNLKDFDKMEKLFGGMGIKDWTVDAPCNAGRLKKNAGFQISPEQCFRPLGYGFGNGFHSGAPGFACGLHLMSVNADGSISKCTFYSDRPVGRIEDGLVKCWQRIKPIPLAKLKCDCKHIESCRGGCRFRAENLGDPYGKDLYRCAHFRKQKYKEV